MRFWLDHFFGDSNEIHYRYLCVHHYRWRSIYVRLLQPDHFKSPSYVPVYRPSLGLPSHLSSLVTIPKQQDNEHNHTPSGDWSAGDNYTESGVGGRPFRPAHNRAISRSTRGTHFQVVSKDTNLTTKNPLTTHSVEVWLD